MRLTLVPRWLSHFKYSIVSNPANSAWLVTASVQLREDAAMLRRPCPAAVES